jgi:DNA-binding NarL/FixJ family response regulator
MAPDALTPRQREVYVRVVRGESDRTIARTLAIEACTVRDHLMAIRRAIGATGTPRRAILEHHYRASTPQK